METSESNAVAEEKDEYTEVEHLPPLLEDEENVSLADILSLRANCLSEEEVWAVCAECVLALKSIRPSHLFHTLCITPDTLAFNAHGNVCFMEQLSDDPEGSFVPPEFDNTGSTFEGHVYSLGSTLSAALSFVIEPELEVEVGDEVQRLLEKMQEDNPEDRPLLQDIIFLAEARLSHTSSAAVCRKLSSVGRRVLSIESVATFQEGKECCWEARWQHQKPKYLLKILSSEDHTKELHESPAHTNGLSRHQICRGWDSSLWAEDMNSRDGESLLFMEMDYRPQNISSVKRRPHQNFSRMREALNRSCSVPDSNNPPCLSPAAHGDISLPVSDLTEIGDIGDGEQLRCESVWSNRLHRLSRGKSCEPYVHSSADDCLNSDTVDLVSKKNEEILPSGERRIEMCKESQTNDSEAFCASCHEVEAVGRDPSMEEQTSSNIFYVPNNHMTKSMLCLNEESQDEWISLRGLLDRCGRKLTFNELWALCYMCLSSLKSYIDYPAYLCLDTLYVDYEGDILFIKPKTIGSYDAFYLAPEYQEHGIMTEKACVYAVAAILWATVKFSLSPNEKLAVPCKLKRLLLDMAKRTPIERPSIVMVKKICQMYLTHEGTDAETVWNNLIDRVHQPPVSSSQAESIEAVDIHQSSVEDSRKNTSGLWMGTQRNSEGTEERSLSTAQ